MAKRGRDIIGLDGATVLITGGTRGIGLATARQAAAAKARVVVTSRHGADCERVAARLARDFRTQALGVDCDVSDAASVRRLFRRIGEAGVGPVTGLVCNAGYPVDARLWNTPLHRLRQAELVHGYEQVHRVDLVGSRLCTHAALPGMMRAGGGSIVYLSSSPALSGYKGSAYTEAKAGILGLMKDVAREYGPKHVRANAIAPGNVRTDWLDQIAASERRLLERESPLRRFGEPTEIASVILFFLGRQSSFVTGQTIVVDGGTVSH